MSNRAVYVGLDIGYGTLDGVCSHHDGGKKPYFFNMPSLVSVAINDDMEFESKVLNKRNVERVVVNERMYHVGEDAGNTIKELKPVLYPCRSLYGTLSGRLPVSRTNEDRPPGNCTASKSVCSLRITERIST